MGYLLDFGCICIYHQSKTTGDTPFFLTYGREPRNSLGLLFVELKDQPQGTGYHHERMMLQVQIASDLAEDHTQEAQSKMKTQYDQYSKNHHSRVGNKV